jgi:hypothetical protein
MKRRIILVSLGRLLRCLLLAQQFSDCGKPLGSCDDTCIIKEYVNIIRFGAVSYVTEKKCFFVFPNVIEIEIVKIFEYPGKMRRKLYPKRVTQQQGAFV